MSEGNGMDEEAPPRTVEIELSQSERAPWAGAKNGVEALHAVAEHWGLPSARFIAMVEYLTEALLQEKRAVDAHTDAEVQEARRQGVRALWEITRRLDENDLISGHYLGATVGDGHSQRQSIDRRHAEMLSRFLGDLSSATVDPLMQGGLADGDLADAAGTAANWLRDRLTDSRSEQAHLFSLKPPDNYSLDPDDAWAAKLAIEDLTRYASARDGISLSAAFEKIADACGYPSATWDSFRQRLADGWAKYVRKQYAEAEAGDRGAANASQHADDRRLQAKRIGGLVRQNALENPEDIALAQSFEAYLGLPENLKPLIEKALSGIGT